jgi:hypothetical protein
MRFVECVDFEPDYANKVIRITVRIDFYVFNLTNVPTSRHRAAAQRAAEAIIRFWSGHKFKCFEVEFVLDWRLVQFSEQFRSNAIDVGLVDDLAYRSHVRTATKTGVAEDRLSDDPGQRGIPVTEAGPTPVPHPDRPSPRGARWGLKEPPSTYAHEVGHILGLDDGYLDDHVPIRHPPDHPPDLMSEQAHAAGMDVTPEMITKIIRRSGKVDESKVVCPLTLDMGPMDWNLMIASLSGIRVHAWTCDYDPPSSDPTRQPKAMEFKGTVDYSGEMHQQIGDPFGLGATGHAHYEVAFPLEIPGDLKIQGQGISFLGRGVEWTGSPPESGVPRPWVPASGVQPNSIPYLASGVMFLGGPEGALLSTEACWPGPKLVPVFTEGAPECDQ